MIVKNLLVEHKISPEKAKEKLSYNPRKIECHELPQEDWRILESLKICQTNYKNCFNTVSVKHYIMATGKI